MGKVNSFSFQILTKSHIILKFARCLFNPINAVSTNYYPILDKMPPISLEQMSSIRLMNRTDCKYLANEPQLEALLSMAQSEYMVQEIDGKREAEYTTTYLDDALNTMYINHHNRRLTRQKVRVRTYVDTGTSFFEVKLKNNHGRTKKKRIELTGADTYVADGAAHFLAQHAMLDLPLSAMTPKISNHFKRITLVNNNKTERLTIDHDLSFHNRESGLDRNMDNLVVIEVKRDGNTYSPILEILRELRIFPCGFSKYCIGMALTLPGIKRNLFNDRIRRIEKITSI